MIVEPIEDPIISLHLVIFDGFACCARVSAKQKIKVLNSLLEGKYIFLCGSIFLNPESTFAIYNLRDGDTIHLLRNTYKKSFSQLRMNWAHRYSSKLTYLELNKPFIVPTLANEAARLTDLRMNRIDNALKQRGDYKLLGCREECNHPFISLNLIDTANQDEPNSEPLPVLWDVTE